MSNQNKNQIEEDVKAIYEILLKIESRLFYIEQHLDMRKYSAISPSVSITPLPDVMQRQEESYFAFGKLV